MNSFNVQKAVALQKFLSSLVRKEGRIDRLKSIVGLDVAYVGDTGVAVAALLEYPSLTLKEYVVVRGYVPIPYIPGLLAFREAPLLIKAYEKLGIDADLVVVDGHGITHPRKFGIASHIGVVLDVPSIGAAKKILVGGVIEVHGRKYLTTIDNELGAIVVERGKKKVYLSIGHKISLEEVEKLIPKIFKTHDLPEPTYIADLITKKERRKLVNEKRKTKDRNYKV